MRKLLVILVIPLFISLIRPGFFPMQDDLQAFRVFEMVKCLKDFQIPCRWIPDMGYQYGYPQFNYYPPSVFYAGGILNLLGIQVIDSVKILFALGFILSGLTMFIFLKALVGEFPALVGALLYSVMPYKAAEVYVRGSLSEFFSFVLFPLIFYSIYNLLKLNKLRYLCLLSVSVALLLTTHNLMSFIFLPLAGIWTVALSIIYKKWKIFPKVILGSILGLGLAASFTLPVIFESQFVHLETLTGGYFDYRQHFVSFSQMFFSNNFGYGSSQLGIGDDLSLSVGIIHWVLALLALVFVAFKFKKDKSVSMIVSTLLGMEAMVVFLMHQRSSFIWEVIPSFKLLQFPWRFLSDSGFLLSTLGALAVYLISGYKKKLGMVVGVSAIVLVYILHISFFQPKEWFNITDFDKFSGQSWEKQLTISIFDYLPIYAKLPPNKKAPELPETLEGQVNFKEYSKGSDFQIGEVEATSGAVLRLPLFDFPGMEVKIDGQKINHTHNDCRGEEYCLGLITFNLPPGSHKIEARLKDTPVRAISNIITLISIIVVSGLFLKSKNETSK